jgi:hypothetical protein
LLTGNGWATPSIEGEIMQTNKYQKGLSLWSFSFNIFLLGVAVFIALKLFPIYMEDLSIGSAVESLETDSEEFRGALSVRDALLKRFDINNVTLVDKDKISITRDEQDYLVEVDYEVEVPFIGNISLIIRFEHSAVVRASV